MRWGERLRLYAQVQGVYFEQLILPDEIHSFLRHASWLRAYTATAEYLDGKVAKRAR